MNNKSTKILQKGFTLVELLVVIGILGILAAALLAVVDPIEQLNKGNDTAKKNVAVEFVSAMYRFYASKQQFPMDVTGTTCGAGGSIGNTLNNLGGCTTELTAAGELKSSFATTSTTILSAITGTRTAPSSTVTACFQPQSKAYKADSQAQYAANGGAGTSCTTTATNPCYWCAR